MTRSEYFTKENALEYFSNSQWKSFLDCEAATMAELKGEYKRPDKKVFLYGRVFEDFYQRGKTNEEGIYKKNGEVYAEFADVTEIVTRVKSDKFFSWMTEGETQVEFNGVIAGQKWRCLVDVINYDRGFICDLKTCADFQEDWELINERNTKVQWYDKYFRQMAIYQELARQATGKGLEVFLAGVTKQTPPDFQVVNMGDQGRLQMELLMIESKMLRISSVKAGTETPIRCEHCEYCRKTKKLTGAIKARNIYMESK